MVNRTVALLKFLWWFHANPTQRAPILLQRPANCAKHCPIFIELLLLFVGKVKIHWNQLTCTHHAAFFVYCFEHRSIAAFAQFKNNVKNLLRRPCQTLLRQFFQFTEMQFTCNLSARTETKNQNKLPFRRHYFGRNKQTRTQSEQERKK